MVSKVGILIVVVLVGGTAMAAILGTQPGADLATDGGDGGNGVTPTPPPVTQTAAATATATAQPTPTAEEVREPSSFDTVEIEGAVASLINEERERRGLRALRATDRLTAMARTHSANMAVQGFTSHDAAGLTTAERYQEADLEGACRIVDNSNTGVREGRALETLARRTVGRPGEVNGERTLLTDESAVAASIVEAWFDDEAAAKKLLLSRADEVGVGVDITADGKAYVTLDLC